MPQESQLAHRVLTNLALPYITNVSPANTDPHYVSGSTDLLTTINGYAERRPGFATAVEPTPTAFNNLQRLFDWDRFDGNFYTMACDINASGFAQVFKLQQGTDTSFVPIFTDTTSTPFDFVVSNNTLYFSNGNVAKKYDPVNGVTNWGISISTINSSVNAYAGTGADFGGPTPWANPTRIQGAPDLSYTTVSLVGVAGSLVQSNALDATNYGFAIAAANTIQGIQLDLTGLQSLQFFSSYDRIFLVLALENAGLPIGYTKTVVMPTSAGTVTLGGPSDNWGASLTPSIVNSSSFGVRIVAWINLFSSSPGRNATFSLDAAKITVYESGGPVVTVSGSAGTMTATAGYTYVYCYGNAATGHISSPTLPSNNTGMFTNKLNVSVPILASTDPQVSQIRVFRTTDGGGGIYFELPTSPYANASTSILDTSPDVNLNILSIAPTATFNDPPTPFLRPVYFAGRIWGFKGNRVYFSGLEEINQGVPEESFPSGIAGNFWTFDEPVQALGTAGMGANQVLTVLCGGRLFAITGTTLDTFQRVLVSSRRGARNLTCVSSMGGMMAWLDSANQVWATDGNSLQEISGPIRNALSGITQANCSLTFHTAGRFNWLLLSVGSKASSTLAPTAAADVASAGIITWSNPTNIEVQDGNYATATGVNLGISHYLQATGFGLPFSYLPVLGIQVQIKGFQSNTTGGETFQVQLLKNGVAVGGIKTTQLPGSNGFITLGGATDNWTAGLSNGDVSQANFGVQMWGNESLGSPMNFNVDFVQVTVFYGGTFVFDVDQEQWMPPWSFAPQYLFSGEIAPGNYSLQAATATKALQLSTTAFNDNSVTFQPQVKVSLLSVIPDYGSRFSYIGMGSYNEPTRTGVPYTFQLTNNGQTISDFKILTDDDTGVGIYNSIVANLQDTATTYNRTNGTNLKQLVFPTTAPAARWVSMLVILANADQVDNLYELFMAYKPLGGR